MRRAAMAMSITLTLLGASTAVAAPHTNPNAYKGTVKEVTYFSKVRNENRKLVVWLPQSYSKSYSKGSRRYPVLYLQHGGVDDDYEWSWVRDGSADKILNETIGAGRAKEMIVVMPNGAVYDNTKTPLTPWGLPPVTQLPGDDPYVRELVGAVIPFVDANYRTIAKKSGRGLAGLSQGGLQTLNTMIMNPDLMDWWGVWSSGVGPLQIADVEMNHKDKLAALSKAHPYLELRLGDQDTLGAEGQPQTQAFLDRHKIEYTYLQVPGAHDWTAWKQMLRLMLPRTFNNAKWWKG